MKTYTGSPAPARNYVEAGRSRADDYYLAEGTGVARHFRAGPDGRVIELGPLSGGAYEAWVAGVDPDTGQLRGRVRQDARAVRFAEVVVNGPKSWSLAAELHPDISAAYDAAQDRAAEQIIGWLGQHATTRVGPRGAQVQIPVEMLEAVTIAHRTSRAGDPHRHLHLQVNARVFAAGQWRGLHTVGVRDSLAAINGIGHAAVATDPGFRAALAAHGYTLNAEGEIAQLARFTGPFSQRAAQIARNVNRFKADWVAVHPGEEPSGELRRTWDARAWAQGRPDKVRPVEGEELTGRWVQELADLGYREPTKPVEPRVTPIGSVDRDRAVELVLTRLAARRSAWNPADIRGDVEQHLAQVGVVADAGVRQELAEDLTARAVAASVRLIDGESPEHVRALTSRHVLDVEADLVTRLATRGSAATTDFSIVAGETLLDTGQTAAVMALAGGAELVVIEGAAGAGKTTTLSAARDALADRGGRLVVVTPTLKAAKVAEAELGAKAGSVAWLVFQHGWRWDTDGAWTRLGVSELDPATGFPHRGPNPNAVLRPGDLLVVDEAGMLDQDTARALLSVADEQQVRVALVGDRRQLSAVGRGGVLDLAARWVDPDSHIVLDGVHRFTRDTVTTTGETESIPDAEYAKLSLQMRTGDDPGAVFDALQARGQVRLHADDSARLAGVAEVAADAHNSGGGSLALVVDTRDQAAEINAAVRERLVWAGAVDDRDVTLARGGQRVGVGDRVATRRNDPGLGVANRDTWTVTGVHADGVTLVGANCSKRELPVSYVGKHVELAYASTAHGVQGDTVTAAHLVLGERTGAAAAYVGMTRGRSNNTAHLVAADVDEAREQWVAAFGKDRADLGPTQAGKDAATENANYTQPRSLDSVLSDLRTAWLTEQTAFDRLAFHKPRLEQLHEIVALHEARPAELAAETARWQQARDASVQANDRYATTQAVVSTEAEQIFDTVMAQWNTDRPAAREAAGAYLAGPGRFGRHRSAHRHAAETLDHWSETWADRVPDLAADRAKVAAFASRPHDGPDTEQALRDHARTIVEQAHPEHATHRQQAQVARTEETQAQGNLRQSQTRFDRCLNKYGNLGHTDDPHGLLVRTEDQIVKLQTQLAGAKRTIEKLTAEVAARALTPEQLAAERATTLTAERNLAAARRAAAADQTPTHPGRQHHMPRPDPAVNRTPAPGR